MRGSARPKLSECWLRPLPPLPPPPVQLQSRGLGPPSRASPRYRSAQAPIGSKPPAADPDPAPPRLPAPPAGNKSAAAFDTPTPSPRTGAGPKGMIFFKPGRALRSSPPLPAGSPEASRLGELEVGATAKIGDDLCHLKRMPAAVRLDAPR